MRDVNSLPGLHTLRTMFSARKRSIPRVQSSTYLDLFMLGKEKERLLKQSEQATMRDTDVKKRLAEIDLEMNSLQGVEAPVKRSGTPDSLDRAFTGQDGAKKEWKTIKLNY